MTRRPSDTASAPSYADEDFRPWLEYESGRFDRALRLLTHWVWDHVYRLEAHGAEHVPSTGAFLLVPNHSSYADPFLHARPQSRHLRFMAKASMFEYPLMRSFMKAGGGFPVRRGAGDTFAMELARRLLDLGRGVVIYPEGTRFRGALELGPAKRGFARLALEARVPVVPVATYGAKRRELYGRGRWSRPRVTTVYGEPMSFDHLDPTPESAGRLRDEVWSRVSDLYEQARELDARR